MPRATAHRSLITALFIVSLLGAMNVTIVSASLATIVGDLGGLEHIAWAVTAYTLAGTVMIPVVGQLGDLLGRRPVLLGSIVVYTIGSLLCGLADSMLTLTLTRALAGAGGAAIGLLPQTIIADVFPPRDRAKWASLLASVFGIATVAGPAIGGIVTDTLGWRWIFFLNLPFALVALALAWRSVPQIREERVTRLDYPGAALVGVAVTGLTLLATLGGRAWAWTSPPALLTAAVSVAAAVGLVLVERRAAQPIVPFQMFRAFGVRPAMVLAVTTGAGMLSLVSYLPAYAQMHYNTSTVVAGMVPVGITVGLIIASNTTGHLVSRTGRYWAYPVVGTIIGATALLLAGLTLPRLPLWLLAGLFVLVGLGTGTFLQLSVVLIQSSAPRRFLGVATSTTNLFRQMGITLGTAMAGGFLGAELARRLADTSLPDGVSASSLTPAVLAEATTEVRAEIAAAYSGAMAPILLAAGGLYACAIVAAVVLPRHLLDVEPARADAD
ncbi:MFS transporter [Demequina sp. SYSU T00039]|uniref:MFS transporter n=1 Tax=Demequina lignilytica TaxID=3051663 RepID=A0AAW7M0Q0_9MICO|nr:MULTISPECIES: MFS transporter [unclassified Demequina]MDN4477925.1 MFS transporter [Demequina sp. SYSU T00039-1]MDN4487834.1 MFS transporter [Demequina sp. SYSU T00039]MDN4490783.1 MFS transporter [Demequina sp. SYSU T00068]